MFISHDGAELYTVAFGAGPRTVVGLGGWAGSWELWAEPFSTLSRTWRTVAYDHRGAGATLAAPESITVKAMVADLFAVLDALSIERCVLAAESAGAAIALLAALEQPHRFQGLVLVDGLYHRTAPTGPDPFVLGLQTDFDATIAAFVDACLTEADGPAVRRWGRQILGRSSPAAAMRLYESLYGLDLRPDVGRIAQPTLLIHGGADRIVSLDASEWLAGQIPHSRLHVVRGAGHVPTITHGEEVANAIDRYFEEECEGVLVQA